MLLYRNSYSLKTWLLFALFHFATPLFAQPRLTSSASEKEIGKNEYVEIQYTVENAVNVQEIKPPVFRNFDVVSGPNQQSGMNNINGQVTRFIGIAYVLKPRSTGSFTLPGATAKADGRDLRSTPLTIVVNNSNTSNKSGGNSFTSPFANLILDDPAEPQVREYDDYILRKGENLEEKIRKNIFVKVEVNRTSCYVGEPLIATYKLYTRLKSESSLIKSPALNGFSVSELGNAGNSSLSTQKFNGREYSVYILRKVQLYPLQAGNVELDPVEIDNKITFIKAEYASSRKGDLFYNMLRDFSDATTPAEALLQRKIALKSEPQMIVVKPLPEANRPDNFKGAVGDFKVQASLEKGNLTTDDAGSLRMIIAGEGNFQMINAPKLSWPKGIDNFDPRSSENLSKTAVPMRGEKVFTYPFTISHPGTYLIPGITLSYFDPSIQTYKIINTRDFKIEVTQGTGVSPAIILPGNSGRVSDPPNTFYENWWVLAAGGIICLMLVIMLIRKRRNPGLNNIENPHTPEVAPSNELELISKNPLSEPQSKLGLGDSRDFYKSLQESIRTYLSGKLHVPPDELTKKTITERLDKCNVGTGTTVKLLSLMDDIEMNLYSPFSSSNQMGVDYDNANEIVSLIDKQVY